MSQASRDALLQQYQGLRMKNDEQVLQFRARLSEIKSNLSGVGYKPDEEETIKALLRGLRPGFDVTAETI